MIAVCLLSEPWNKSWRNHLDLIILTHSAIPTANLPLLHMDMVNDSAPLFLIRTADEWTLRSSYKLSYPSRSVWPWLFLLFAWVIKFLNVVLTSQGFYSSFHPSEKEGEVASSIFSLPPRRRVSPVRRSDCHRLVDLHFNSEFLPPWR